jgi:hypothetical protein
MKKMIDELGLGVFYKASVNRESPLASASSHLLPQIGQSLMIFSHACT